MLESLPTPESGILTRLRQAGLGPSGVSALLSVGVWSPSGVVALPRSTARKLSLRTSFGAAVVRPTGEGESGTTVVRVATVTAAFSGEPSSEAVLRSEIGDEDDGGIEEGAGEAERKMETGAGTARSLPLSLDELLRPSLDSFAVASVCVDGRQLSHS